MFFLVLLGAAFGDESLTFFFHGGASRSGRAVVLADRAYGLGGSRFGDHPLDVRQQVVGGIEIAGEVAQPGLDDAKSWPGANGRRIYRADPGSRRDNLAPAEQRWRGPLDESGVPFEVARGQHVLDRFPRVALFGKPAAGPQVKLGYASGIRAP